MLKYLVRSLDMKYVYAVLTVLENKPIMWTLLSDKRITGRKYLTE